MKPSSSLVKPVGVLHTLLSKHTPQLSFEWQEGNLEDQVSVLLGIQERQPQFLQGKG